MASDKNPLRAFLRTNRGLKAVALVLAFISWYAIREAISSEAMVKNVRLNVLTDDGWTVLDQSVPDVDVVFRGSEEELRYVRREQVAVQVNMRGKSRDGVTVVKLRSDNVKAPTGARAVRVDPAEITISLDREGDKEVPVKADIAGSPPEGFEVEKVVCTPATVVIHGPRQLLSTIDSIRTDPIDLAGRARSFRLSKPVHAPLESWNGRIEPDTVRVEVAIAEGSAQLPIDGIVVSALVQPDRRDEIRLSPGSVRVTLSGPPDRLRHVEKEQVLAFVDCSALQPGASINLPVRITPSQGLEVVGVEPPMVKAEVGAAP